MSEYDEKLSSIAAQLTNGVTPPSERVHVFLGWFGAERRGWRVVNGIRSALSKYNLVTEPDFETAYYYGRITFQDAHSSEAPTAIDPTTRLAELEAANRAPVTVPPDAPLEKAISEMLARDFSQLPVMCGSRDPKGLISWKSIGSRLAMGRDGTLVKDFMGPTRILNYDSSLFEAIAAVAQDDCVIVQAKDKTICGIITATDVNEQFLLLAEPFLLIGEIERGVRALLHGRYSATELAAVRQAEDGREIAGVADLTLGECIRLLQEPESWSKLGLHIDRAQFCEGLDSVRETRNDVMHFSPEGIEPVELAGLRDFAAYLRRLRGILAS
jgi:CBS domain-containing protein